MIKRELLKNFVKLFSVDLLLGGIGFLLLPIYLNLMTPSEFGFYSYIISIIGALAYLFSMGQYATLNRFYHVNEYKKNEIIETINLIILSCFILFLFIFIAFKHYIIQFAFSQKMSAPVYYLIIVLGLLAALRLILRAYFYQEKKIKIAQYENLFYFISVHIISILMLLFISNSKVELRLIATAVAGTLTILLFYKTFLFYRNILLRNSSKNLYLRGTRNGLPMALGSLINYFIAFGDRFVIEKLLTNSSLGIYSFAMVFISLNLMIFNSVQNAWLPYFFAEKNMMISLKRIYKFIVLFLFLTPVITISIYIVIHVIANNFIDHSYILSLDFLWILMLASFLQVAGMFIAGFYQIFEKNHLVVPINVAVAFGNIALNYILIPQYGLRGAAIATFLVSLLLFILHFSIVHYFIKTIGSSGEYHTSKK
ncbi:MAG: lipopolysaccharide biosynthesis protein [Rhodomicrobiaceae bacterium]